MFLQLLLEANTCLPCSLDDLPANLRRELRLRLSGFVSCIEKLEEAQHADFLPMSRFEKNAHELMVLPLQPDTPLRPAS